jgi:hypothetical protein
MKANKLLILKVDTGIDVRTIVRNCRVLNQKILLENVTVLEFGSKKPSRRGKSRNDFDDYEC